MLVWHSTPRVHFNLQGVWNNPLVPNGEVTLRFFPRAPKTFLFVCLFSLICIGTAHGGREWLAQSMSNAVVGSAIEHWVWSSLTPLIAGYVIALLTVFLYNIFTYRSMGSREEQLIAQMETLKTSNDELRVALSHSHQYYVEEQPQYSASS